jgi:hypothetical protein
MAKGKDVKIDGNWVKDLLFRMANQRVDQLNRDGWTDGSIVALRKAGLAIGRKIARERRKDGRK